MNLGKVLKGCRTKEVVLTGYMAHVGVNTTNRQVTQKGYGVLVVKDGIGDCVIPDVKGEELTKVTLAELGDVLATVLKSEEIKWTPFF